MQNGLADPKMQYSFDSNLQMQVSNNQQSQARAEVGRLQCSNLSQEFVNLNIPGANVANGNPDGKYKTGEVLHREAMEAAEREEAERKAALEEENEAKKQQQIKAKKDKIADKHEKLINKGRPKHVIEME